MYKAHVGNAAELLKPDAEHIARLGSLGFSASAGIYHPRSREPAGAPSRFYPRLAALLKGPMHKGGTPGIATVPPHTFQIGLYFNTVVLPRGLSYSNLRLVSACYAAYTILLSITMQSK